MFLNLFDEMKNDGFALSNNRKPINDNDIPEIKNRILKFFRNEKNIDENLVSKKTILSSNDITLKKSRYFSKIKNLSKYKLEKLEDVIEYIDDGDWIETKDQIVIRLERQPMPIEISSCLNEEINKNKFGFLTKRSSKKLKN